MAHIKMRPVSRGNSRHSLVGGATCQKTPITWSALDKNLMAEPISKAILWMKAQHEGAVTPWCIVQKNLQVPHTNRQVACHPMNNARVKQSSSPPHKTRPDSPVPTLQGLCDPSQIRRIRSQERNPVVHASTCHEALFHCDKPSGVPRGPANSTVSINSQDTLGSSLRTPAEVEGNDFSLQNPRKTSRVPLQRVSRP